MITTVSDIRKTHDVLIAYGDRHVPHTNKHLENILFEIIKEVKPTHILDGGDMISADCLSNFPKRSYQLGGLQEEIDEDYKWRMKVNSVAKSAKKIILKDNHFFRRLEDKKKESIWLEDLRELNAETILKCKELGWNLVTEYDWKDQILFVHGDDDTKGEGSQDRPSNKIRMLRSKLGGTVVRFHSHTTAIEAFRGKKGETCYAIQLGTFEDVSSAGYIKHQSMCNWTTSAGVFYLSKTDDTFLFQPILFSKNKAVFNGKLYS